LFASTVEMGRAIFTACLLGFTTALTEHYKAGFITKDQAKALTLRGGDIMSALLSGQSVNGVALNNLGTAAKRVNEAVSLTTSLYALSKIAPEETTEAWEKSTKKPQPWQSDEGSNVEG
jgi:hypothetical protein